MNDLFRFLLLRPASLAGPGRCQRIDGQLRAPRNEVGRGTTPSPRVHRQWGICHFRRGLGIFKGCPRGSFPVARQIPVRRAGFIDCKARHGRDGYKDCSQAKFTKEEKLLADSLVAMKLLSDSFGADAAGLGVVAQGYDAIGLAAAGRNPVILRVLSTGDFPKADGGTSLPSARRVRHARRSPWHIFETCWLTSTTRLPSWERCRHRVLRRELRHLLPANGTAQNVRIEVRRAAKGQARG